MVNKVLSRFFGEAKELGHMLYLYFFSAIITAIPFIVDLFSKQPDVSLCTWTLFQALP